MSRATARHVLFAAVCVGLVCAALSRTAAETRSCPPEMVKIPAGSFVLGDKPSARRPTLDAYCIDRYPVTNEKYRGFVVATGYPPPVHVFERGRSYDLWRGRDFPPVIARQPVVNVMWLGAETYCRWRGKRLPSEAEWEKAARGADGREYPWGNAAPDASRAWYNRPWQGTPTIKPVGSYPASASPYGVQDMAGNVFQWTASVETDVAAEVYDELSFPGRRVIRGGAFSTDASVLRASMRAFWDPDTSEPSIGFRCAQGLQDETTLWEAPGKVRIRTPLGWTVWEPLFTKQPVFRQSRVVDLLGFRADRMIVSISIRTVDAEGDPVDQHVEDYLADGGSLTGKPFRYAFFPYRDRYYYALDRPIQPIRRRVETMVGGRRAIALTFDAEFLPDQKNSVISHRARIKQVFVGHGSTIYILSLNGVQDGFARDEKIFDDLLNSLRWIP